MNNKQQQGFILALALLLMLFVGLVVITSTERSGEETRISQSDAPTATLQAAAEAGLLTLRQKVEDAVTGGVCSTGDFEEKCSCIDSVNLNSLFDNVEHPSPFVQGGGIANVYWWFENKSDYFDADYIPKDPDDSDSEEACELNARVFVGSPDINSDYFMSGLVRFDRKASPGTPYTGTPFQGTPFEDVFDHERFMLKEGADLDDFYESDFFDKEYQGMTPVLVSSGQSITVNDLADEGVTILVLEGDVDLNGSMSGKNIVIINRNDSVIRFSKETGQNKGKPNGWIIAPDTTIVSEQGSPKIPMSVLVEGCVSGSQNTCNHSSGGSGFVGYTLDGFGMVDPIDDGSGSYEIEVDASKDMRMDFNY